MSSRPRVRVSTRVSVSPAVAFRIFTEETDSWWQRGFRFRQSEHESSTLHFEGGEGGRLVERASDIEGGEFEFGRILVWKPAEALSFAFRARANEPGEESRVDVRFDRDEAEPNATRITVTQTGWEALPADHPVRHGLIGSAFDDMMTVFWADLIHAARRHAEAKPS